MRCWALRAFLASLAVDVDEVELVDDVLLDAVELDESDWLLMSGGGPGGGPPAGRPPAGGAPWAPSDGPAFSKYDDNSDLETLPSPFVSNALNRSSSDDLLLLEDVLLLVDVLLDAA
jgi:hypothetical protein